MTSTANSDAAVKILAVIGVIGLAQKVLKKLQSRNNVSTRHQFTCNCETFRELFEDHFWWTHVVVTRVLGNSPTEAVNVAVNRLMKNQSDIALAIGRAVNSRSVATQQEELWKTHIVLAKTVVEAVKSNSPSLSAKQAEWNENGRQIADSLAILTGGNPDEFRNMLQRHLDTLTEQVVALAGSKWQEEADAIQIGLDHMMMMADALAAAL